MKENNTLLCRSTYVGLFEHFCILYRIGHTIQLGNSSGFIPFKAITFRVCTFPLQYPCDDDRLQQPLSLWRKSVPCRLRQKWPEVLLTVSRRMSTGPRQSCAQIFLSDFTLVSETECRIRTVEGIFRSVKHEDIKPCSRLTAIKIVGFEQTETSELYLTSVYFFKRI